MPDTPTADAAIEEWANYARSQGIIVSQGRVSKAEIVASLTEQTGRDFPRITAELDEEAGPGELVPDA